MTDYGKLSVLLVEADNQKSKQVKKVFSEIGCENVWLQKDYEKAAESVKKHACKVVVVGGGFSTNEVSQVIAHLRKSCEKTIPLILITASNDSAFVRGLVSLGLSAVLKEPLSEGQVMKSLESCLHSVSNLSTVKQLISESVFFDEFTKEEREALLKVAQPRSFLAGEEIITKGDLADSFYVILQGKVMVVIVKKDHTTIDITLDRGSPFGEMAILDNSLRSAWCVAVEDSIVLEIGSHIIKDPAYNIRLKLFAKLAMVMAERIRKMNQMIDDHMQEGMEQVIAHPEDVHIQTHHLGLASEWLGAGQVEPQVAQMLVPAIEPMVQKSQEREEIQEADLQREREKVEELKRKKEEEEKKQLVELEEKRKKEALEKEKKRQRVEKRRKEREKEEQDDSGRKARQRELRLDENPYTVPIGVAENYHQKIVSQDEYDVLSRKVNLRADFIAAKVPKATVEMIGNRMFGYWTGSKLAKVNPHHVWNAKLFTPGSPQLKKALHLVVFASQGNQLFKDAFLGLPLSHRVVGLPDVGCSGTFLGTDESIDRYLQDECLKNAIKLDMEIPIDRNWKGKDVIEFLTHTSEDVRDETLFLVVDDRDGKNTKKVRERFPRHQMITVVNGVGYNVEDLGTMFSFPEEQLTKENLLVPKSTFKGEGFYQGQTVFFPDISNFYEDMSKMEGGHLFGTIGVLARIGPDYSGIVWGSKGGAEGAVKAARAMFGISGATNSQDIAAAVNWADGDANAE